jgi:hypothetical protein
MKKLLLAILPLLAANSSFAQINTNTDTTAIGVGATSTVWNYKFSYQNKSIAHYGLGWYHDSDFTGGPIGYLGGYGGVKFFTAGTPRAIIDHNGNFGIGILNPNAKLDVNGAILLSGSNGNTMPRPAVGSNRVTGEISSYSTSGLAYDDGFLRLSAGGGTNASVKTFIDLTGYSTVPDMDRNLVLGTAGIERLRIDNSGNVGIGTTKPDAKLEIVGLVHASEVLVNSIVPQPDYVFDKDYNLTSLKDVKTYIDQNHHLPEIPSAAQQVKEGINLGEMNAKLLKKIEELTLYLIEKDKQLAEQQTINHNQEERLKKIERQLSPKQN